MVHLDAGVALEHLGGEINDAARPGGAVEQGLSVSFGEGDEALQIARRHYGCAITTSGTLAASDTGAKSSNVWRARPVTCSDEVVVENVTLCSSSV